MGIAPGMSLDLTEKDVAGLPWNFNNPAKRAKAEQLVMSKKALLIIGSPMCLNFCKMSPEDIEQIWRYRQTHLEFRAKLYKIQHTNCVYFLHEHPYGAKSWQEKCIVELLEMEGVTKVKSHMCAFGMRDSDGQGRGCQQDGWRTRLKLLMIWRNRVVVITDTLRLWEEEEREESRFIQENFVHQIYSG